MKTDKNYHDKCIGNWLKIEKMKCAWGSELAGGTCTSIAVTFLLHWQWSLQMKLFISYEHYKSILWEKKKKSVKTLKQVKYGSSPDFSMLSNTCIPT